MFITVEPTWTQKTRWHSEKLSNPFFSHFNYKILVSHFIATCWLQGDHELKVLTPDPFLLPFWDTVVASTAPAHWPVLPTQRPILREIPDHNSEKMGFYVCLNPVQGWTPETPQGGRPSSWWAKLTLPGRYRQENQRRQEVSQVLCQPWEGPNQSHSHTRLGLKLGFHIILSLPAHGLCCGSSLCRTTDMQKGANTERPLTIVLWPWQVWLMHPFFRCSCSEEAAQGVTMSISFKRYHLGHA
jgi:hypothetical protein